VVAIVMRGEVIYYRNTQYSRYRYIIVPEPELRGSATSADLEFKVTVVSIMNHLCHGPKFIHWLSLYSWFGSKSDQTLNNTILLLCSYHVYNKYYYCDWD
jgi:hypothetical protein